MGVALDPGPSLTVEVFSDIVCPWCYIGHRRFSRAVESLHTEVGFPFALEVVHRPFQLDPGAPRGQTEPVLDAYARKFGGAERAAALIAHVTAVAAAEGLEFHLDRALRANTADAHRLLWWTLWQHGATVQLCLAEALMAAYFTDGADIGDLATLAERADRCGVPAADALAFLDSDSGIDALAVGLRRAADRDITAVPTYLIDDRWAIPGAQDTAVFVKALRRLAAHHTAISPAP